MAVDDDVYRIGTWRDYVKQIPFPTGPAFPLNAERSALIVVDMTVFQCDKDAPAGVAHTLFHAGGKAADYYFDSMRRVIPVIRNLVDFARRTRIQVVFLTLGPYLASEREMPYFMRN